MHKLTFTFDENKMKSQSLNIEECYHKINRIFNSFDFKVVQTGAHFECLGSDDEHDMSYSFLLMKALKNSEWFKTSIIDWYLCYNDYYDDPTIFDKEDLYECYVKKESRYGEAV